MTARIADHNRTEARHPLARIAYLGGGNMAQAMARCLLADGHDVTMYNRTPQKLHDLRALGACIAATPREAVAGCEVIFASVSDDAASRAIWTAPDGALDADIRPGALLVEHSTLSREWVLELSGIVRDRGLRYLDCPVAGRPDAAAAGQLMVFAGAAPADLAAVEPYLRPIMRELFHFGPAGAGTAFKLIYNLMGVVQIVALAEGLVAAERAGIDPSMAVRAFARGNTGSPHVSKHGPAMAENRHEAPPAFTVGGRLKDCRYGVALEQSLGLNPRVGRAALATYQRMAAQGMERLADTRLIDMMREPAPE